MAKRNIASWTQQPLTEIVDATVDVAVDRASGVELCNTMLISRAGEGWAVPASDKKDAEANARQIKEFLGIA